MAVDPEAVVIPLHEYSARSGANRRAQGRADSMRRHPTMRWRQYAGNSAGDVATVVREIDAHRGSSDGAKGPEKPHELARRIGAVAEFVRCRLTGDYSVDEFGFDPQLNEAVLMPLLRTIFTSWFRVEVSGIEHLPETGAALVVANHAGVLPFDGLMASVAVHDKHPAGRSLRLLAADAVFGSPLLGQAARKAGHTVACTADADRLLSNGELTAVFPEGYKGLGKCFKDRYKLQRFGRGGFVSAALRAKAPIVPCSIVGSEEIYPMIGEVTVLARLFRLPFFPITPLFPLAGPIGMIPLPSKWHIEFGEPIPTTDYDDAAPDDPMLIFELSDHVRETIQRTLYRRLINRRNTFLG